MGLKKGWITAVLVLCTAYALAAHAADPPAVSDVLDHFPSDPAGFLERLHPFCDDESHAEQAACVIAADVDTWGGRYRNTPVEVVPPVALPAKASGYMPANALDVIPPLARDKRVVIINEVHDNPETRLLPAQLLAPLRKLGFDTLAMETLSTTDSGLQQRGYPVFASGYYTREPTMGRLVRAALALGYRVVGYDSLAEGTTDIDAREQAQAGKLATLLREGKGHRMVVLAGLAHAYKKPGTYLGGKVPMARRLWGLLGSEPLSVDQVYAFDGATGRELPGNGFFAFAKAGRAWSAMPGQFDVSVVARVNRSLPAREAWQQLAPELRLVKAGAGPCGGKACMVAAFRPGDGADAVPLDQAEARPGDTSVQLLVPSGPLEYRYIVAGAAAAADDQRTQAAFSQSVDDARHGRYIEASSGLLAHLGVASSRDIKDPDVFDQWAQVMSCMTGLPTFNTAKKADFHVPGQQVADLRAAQGIAAIPEIVRRARLTRIVILDDNHLDPRGRAFALEVARALRPLGYRTLALEVLKRDTGDAESRKKMDQLVADGYPRQSSGYYLDDPVFSDFVRQSLSLGYRPVSYERVREDYAGAPEDPQAQREQDQADLLVRRALHDSPDAKILVYAGEHHIAEHPIAAEGGKVVMMAERLKRLTHIDPLTIDQAGLSSLPMNRPDVDLYAIAAPKAKAGSVVLTRAGKPLVVGLLAGSVDLQVVHPPTTFTAGRPAWLAAMGRKPVPVPKDELPASGTRLVQAFIASEADDAIPVDQVLVAPGQAATLMLPAVPVRYAVQERK